MDKRKQDLAALNDYIEKVDKETTMLLQNLQWDHKHLVESQAMVMCKYEAGHRIPLQSAEAHERQCYLDQLGYSKDEILLPDAADPNAIKFCKHDIMNIINAAATRDPSFKRGVGSVVAEPLSVGRLQTAYTGDERRAIHDAVVAATPSTDQLDDMPLPSGSSRSRAAQSREALLAEVRDMRRRRARYRVRSTTAHYSDVLRDLIKTQMDLYAEAKGIYIKTEYGSKNYVSLETKAAEHDNNSDNILIKQERLSPDHGTRSHHTSFTRERSRSRDRKRQTERREREKHSHRSENNSYNIVIKQERLSPDNESRFENSRRDRSRSRDRRRQTDFKERENDSHKRRHHNYRDDFSELNRSRDNSKDEYSKDSRRYESISDHNKYRKSDQRHTIHSNGNNKEEPTSSKYIRLDKLSYGNHSKSSGHDSSSKDYDKYHGGKHDEYKREYTSKQSNYSSRNEDKPRRHQGGHRSDKHKDY